MTHEQLRGGYAAGLDPRDFDVVELSHGIKVEMEHTPSRVVAREIAMDHLVEDPQYYRRLARMEKGFEHNARRAMIPMSGFTDNPGGDIWALVSVAGAALGAYHGYKRNQASLHPIAWGLWWGFWGSLVPPVTIAIALAEGFGKPAR